MTGRTLVATIGLAIALIVLVIGLVLPAPGSSAAPALDGPALFVAKGCSSCHIGPDSTTAATVGPALVGAAGWAGSRRPGMDAAAYLAESMREPDTFVSPARIGDGEMPVLTLTDDEIERLVDYLLGS